MKADYGYTVVAHDPDCTNEHIYDAEGKWVGYQPGCKVLVWPAAPAAERITDGMIGGFSIEEGQA